MFSCLGMLVFLFQLIKKIAAPIKKQQAATILCVVLFCLCVW